MLRSGGRAEADEVLNLETKLKPGIGPTEEVAPDVRAVFHAKSDKKLAESFYQKIRPDKFKPDNRFGEAFYVAEREGTAIREVNYHAAHSGRGPAEYVLRFEVDMSKVKTLDLTDFATAKKYGYTSSSSLPADYAASIKIAKQAQAEGFQAIRYPSVRGPGSNIAFFGDPDSILRRIELVPIK
jgi:hypothetical protein